VWNSKSGGSVLVSSTNLIPSATTTPLAASVTLTSSLPLAGGSWQVPMLTGLDRHWLEATVGHEPLIPRRVPGDPQNVCRP
jgi:hypothetical protein